MLSLLVPISVAVRQITNTTAVPSVTGAPFHNDLTLESGIHVHWALPDALTRSVSPNSPAQPGMSDTTPKQKLFPGVPDLWLVVRFNPATDNPTRTWRAWVVDSRSQTVTPLEQWNETASSDGKIHTLPGLLSASADQPGWGVWDDSLVPTGQQLGNATTFDAAITSAVYYPTGRKRFGFYDDLSDLPHPLSGLVSYTVIGWYSSQSNDPLAQSSNPSQQIADWKLSYDPPYNIEMQLTPINALQAQSVSAYNPELSISPAETPANPASSAKSASANIAQRVTEIKTLHSALNLAQANLSSFSPMFISTTPTSIVCHGSITNIDLQKGTAVPTLGAGQISLYPTAKRAMASVASPTLSDQSLDFSEMILQDLDNQKGSTAGILDLPGAAHALTFQSVPGNPTGYAQMRVYDFLIHPVDPNPSPSPIVLLSDVKKSVSSYWPTGFSLKKPDLALQPSQNAKIITPIQIPPVNSTTTYAPPPPVQPSDTDVANFTQNVTNAIGSALAAAHSAGLGINTTMLRVSDLRANAQPINLGPSINGSGTDSGGYWVDTSNTDQMRQLLINTAGAPVDMPNELPVYLQPGPRWFRPWSPVILLKNTGRSYRFGEDGRFDPNNGTLECRVSGNTAYSIVDNIGTEVLASSIFDSPASITSKPGLPAESLSLLQEAAMLDIGSVPTLAASTPASEHSTVQEKNTLQQYFNNAISGWYLERYPNLTDQQKQQLQSIEIWGKTPSPVAITPSSTSNFETLFVDVAYGLKSSPIHSDWKLDEDQVEMTALTSPFVPSGPLYSFVERSRATATTVKNTQSALVTKTVVDPVGRVVKRRDPPSGLDIINFQTNDLLSVPLTQFDSALFARQCRERAGTLAVHTVSAIDVFGLRQTWGNSDTVGASTTLTPRLPFWSRLQLNLLSSDLRQEANATDSPVCGVLLPDFLDHSLQVFDGDGNALGILDHDPANPTIVRFTAFPWIPGAPPAGGDQLSVITNDTLHQLVNGVVAQHNDSPPGIGLDNKWHDTALTALLRVIDTVRATLDPSVNTPDHKVSLLGEPILVMVAMVTLETTADSLQTTNKTDLTKPIPNPTPLAQPPAVPSIPVRIGDITRPDDGVIGLFNPGATPGQSTFAPVSVDAAQHAILNGLAVGIANNPQGVPVTHPFVLNQVNSITVQVDTPQQIILLTDIRGDIYASSGVLPRKSIKVPQDCIKGLLDTIEPAFSVGPVFTVTTPTGSVQPLFPPPLVQGYDALFSAGSGSPANDLPMPPAPPIGDLPPTRVKLDEGWIKMKKKVS